MATVIDALLVTLGLDVNEYKKGIAEAEKAQKKLEGSTSKSVKKMTDEEKKLDDTRKKQAKEQEARAKAMGQGLAKMRNEALGLLAVFTAGVGIKDFVTNTINSEASLSRMSKNLDMTAKDLAEFKLANEKAGGSAEGMVAQLKQSAEDIANLKLGKGPSEAMQAFFRFGGSAQDLKDGNTYLKARADILAKVYATAPTKAMAMAKEMSISEDAFPLMRQGSAGIERLKQEVSGLAAAQAANANQAEALRQKIVDLKQAIETAMVKLLTSFMPTINKLVDAFTNWVKSADFNQLMQKLESLGVVLDALISIISTMVSLLTSIANAVTGGPKETKQQYLENIRIDERLQDVRDKMMGTGKYAHVPPRVGASNIVKSSAVSNTSSSDVKINQVTIHTQAKDGAAVAREFTGALVKHGIATQANTGVH